MNEIYEDDYIDFTEESKNVTFICPSCKWFNGIDKCLHPKDHNFYGRVNGVIMCVDYEKIN